MAKIFIDGSAGTTGLRIHERLAGRKDIELISLAEEVRKDPAARKEAIQNADIAFFCLPDAAAVEAAALAAGSDTVLIDTSTAHRTAEGWTYGFPELKGYRERIRKSTRIANPGCHASGMIALAAPLIEGGLLKADARLSCFSLTGYSGGGKSMIGDYETGVRAGHAADCDEEKESVILRDPLLDAPRQYGLTQQHKHLKEMIQISGLQKAPAFCPVVADYYSGMEVVIPVFPEDLTAPVEEIRAYYKEYYNTQPNGLVHYEDGIDDKGFLSAGKLSGRDDMIITVTGNEDRILLISLFDNLGKGASGAAIQNMNLVLGVPEQAGLAL